MTSGIVDAHVHLHKSIEKERQALPIPGRRDVDRWGNVDTIFPFMDREGVSHIVALNLFPTPFIRMALRDRLDDSLEGPELEHAHSQIEVDLVARLRRHNDWLTDVAARHPRVIAAIGIQGIMGSEEMIAELELQVSRGAKAVKLIPGFFREFPNDRVFWPLYERCQELGVVVVSDTGSLGVGRHRAYPGEYNEICYGEPRLFEDVLVDFPDLCLVMAHFPSSYWDQRVELAARFENLHFDTSGGFDAPWMQVRDGHRAIDEADAVRIMRHVGIERFMFGSDGPHVMLQPYVEQALRLDMTEVEREALLAGNARRVFSIP